MKRIFCLILALTLASCTAASLACCSREAKTATETATERVTDKETSPETQAETDANTETESAPESETQDKTDGEAGTVAETEQETEPAEDVTTPSGTESETERETEAATESETERETEPETEFVTEFVTEAEPQTDPETETSIGIEDSVYPTIEERMLPKEGYHILLGESMVPAVVVEADEWDWTEDDAWMTENYAGTPRWPNLVSYHSSRTMELRMQTVYFPEDEEYDDGDYISINWMTNNAQNTHISQRLNLGTGVISNCGKYFPNVEVQKPITVSGFVQFIDVICRDDETVTWTIRTYANGELVFKAKTNPNTPISTEGWWYPCINNDAKGSVFDIAPACAYQDVRTVNIYVWDNQNTYALYGKTDVEDELIEKLYRVFAWWHGIGEYAEE